MYTKTEIFIVKTTQFARGIVPLARFPRYRRVHEMFAITNLPVVLRLRLTAVFSKSDLQVL